MANEFVTRTGLIVSGSTFLPAVTTASKGYILSFDDTTKQVYYMSTSSVTVTVPGSDTQIIYNNGGAFGAASNFVFSGSNVGIGTTSPLTLLDLRASSNSAITPLASVPDTATTLLIGNTGTNGVLALGHDNDGHPWLQGRSVLANQAPTVILLNPLGGNVGIGTTSPEAKLDVSGSIKISYPTGKLYAAATPSFYGEITPFNASGQMIFNVNYPEGNIIFQSGSVEVARFKDAKLGIGTDSPNVTLEANGIIRSDRVGVASQYVQINGGDAAGPFITAAGAAKVLTIQNNSTTSSDIFFDQAVASTYQFKQATVTKMILDASGNVGIGPTNPSKKLHVEVSAADDGFILSKSGSANTIFRATMDGTNDRGEIFLYNSGTAIFAIRPSSNVSYINTGNNFGIGKTSPNATLDVSGSVLISGSLTVSGSSTFTNIGPAVFTGSITQNASTASFGGFVLVNTTTTPYTDDKLYIGSGNIILDNNRGYLQYTSGGGRATIIGLNSSNNLTVGQSNVNNGSLLLYGGTGYVSINAAASEVARFTTGGDVGIGTTSPGAKLTVYSDTTADGILVDVLSRPRITLRDRGNSDTILGTGDYGLDDFFIDTYSGNAFVIDGGTRNVGIGTTTPAAKLDIGGNATGSVQAIFGRGNDDSSFTIRYTNGSAGTNNTVQGTIGLDYANGYWADMAAIKFIRDSTAGALAFYTSAPANSGVERVRIDSNGNVGIGTTSPSRKLIVYDTDANVPTIGLRTDGSGTTTGDGFDLQFASSNTFLFNRENGYTAFGTNNTERVRIAATGDTHIGTTAYAGIGGSGYLMVKNVIGIVPDNTGNTNNRNWAIQANGQFSGSLDFVTSAASASFPNDAYRVSFTRTGGVVASSFTGSFSGSVSAPGSTTQIVYNSGGALAADSGLVYSGSAVGIGTATPSSGTKLQVDGNIYSNNVGGNSFTLNSFGANYGFISTTANNTFSLGYGPSLGTLGTPVLTWNSSGNVGIGTTTPGEVLEVVGNIRANVSNGGGFMLTGASASGLVRAGATGLALRTNTTDRLTIDNSGNVGIGTASPSALLHVSQPSANTIFRLGNNTTYDQFIYFNGGNDWSLGMDYSNSNAFVLSNASSIGTNDRLVVTTGGNVGIGTTNPTAKLFIEGNDIVLNTEGSAQGKSIYFRYSDGGNIQSDSYLKFSTGGSPTEKMRITSTGDVGIGTTTPSSSLHVAGTITAATTADSGRINLGTQDTNQIGLYRDNTYDLVLLQDASSGNPLYLAGAGDVRVSIDSNNNNTNSKFIVGNNDKKSSNELFSVDESGSGYFSGSLTVQGTITAQKLNVQQVTSSVIYSSGSNIFGNDISNTQTFTGSVLITGSEILNGKLYLGTTTPSTANSLQLSYSTTSGDAVVSSYSSGGNTTLALQTSDAGSPATRLYINSSGNVGIGTTSPNIYSISGATTTLSIQATGTNQGSLLDISATGTGFSGINIGNSTIRRSFLGTLDGSNFVIYTNATNSGTSVTERMRITAAGNVGIGTDSPLTKLTVNGDTNISAASTGNSYKLYFGDEVTSGPGKGMFLETYYLKIQGHRNEGIILQGVNATGSVQQFAAFYGDNNAKTSQIHLAPSGGNVGIGTTSPGTLLHLVQSSGPTIRLVRTSNRFDITADNDFMELNARDASTYMIFRTADTERMRITSAGNVGIGNTSPSGRVNISNATGANAPTTVTAANSYLHLGNSDYGPNNNGKFMIAFGYVGGGPNTNAPAYIGFEETNTGGATKGALTFYTRDVITDTAPTERLYIAPNGNVGIGTTNPSFKLNVIGGNGNQLGLDNAGERFTQLSFLENGSQNSAIWLDGTDNMFDIYTNTSHGIRLKTGGDNTRLTVTSDGNVGIGTTSPSQKLDVNGIINTTAGIIGSNSNNLYLSSNSSAGEISFWANQLNTRLMTISGSGNVGIGTASPVSPLQVNGTAQFGDVGSMTFSGASVNIRTTATGSIALTHTAVRTYTLGINSSGTFNIRDYDAPADRLSITSGGNVGIGTTSPSTKLFISGSHVSGQGMSTFKGSDYAIINLVTPAAGDGSNGYWGFRVQDPNFTDLMWFGHVTSSTQSGFVVAPNFDTANSASFYVARSNGNVGIGTTNPTSLLHISSSSGTPQGITIQGGDESFVKFIQGGGGVKNWGLITTNLAASDFGIYQSTSVGGDPFSAGTAKLYFDGDGNVGIGTTSPGAKLHVVGNTQVSDQFAQGVAISSKITNYGAEFRSSGASAQIFFGRSGDSIGSGAIGADASYALSVWNTSDFSRFLVISQSGNVGIGTTTPSDKLEVSGGGIAINNSSDPYLRFRQSGTIVSDIFTDTSGNNLIVRGSSGVGVEILANGASEGAAHLVVSGSNGNVGIGTASPANKLEVSDTQTTIPQFQIKETSSAYHRFGILKSGSSVHFVEPGNDGLSAAEYLMTINMNGNNVGIGTTSPGYRLDVQSGSANFRYDQPSSTSYTYFRNWASGGSVALLLGTNDSDDSNAEIVFSNNTLYLQSYGDPGSSIQFGTRNNSASAIRMKIDQDGNVGIGTTSPTALLHLSSGTPYIYLDDTSTSGTRNRFQILNGDVGTTQTVTFGFNNTSGTNLQEVIAFNESGNVGIGTTSPGIGDGSYVAPLTINSTSTLGTFLAIKNTQAQYGMGGVWMQANTGNAGWLFGTENDGKAVLHYGSGASETAALTDAKDGTKGITIDTSGNVGIGTISPSYKLQVSGSIAVENQGTTTIESTTFAGTLTTNTNIAFVPTGSFKAAFFDYYVASGSVNMRAGTVMAVHNNSTSRYTDTSTADIGTTAPVDFSTSIVAGSLVLTANIASGTWEIKTAYRAL